MTGCWEFCELLGKSRSYGGKVESYLILEQHTYSGEYRKVHLDVDEL